MATESPIVPKPFKGFRMRSIHIAQFSVVLPTDGSTFDKVLTFEIAPRFGKHNTNHDLGVVAITVRAIPEGGNEEVYSIRAFFNFEFQGNEEEADLRDQENVQKTLIGMSFSTLRGILYEKLAGTPYADQLLITLDTGSFSMAPKQAIRSRSTAVKKAK
jgi:hypothetical protein